MVRNIRHVPVVAFLSLRRSWPVRRCPRPRGGADAAASGGQGPLQAEDRQLAAAGGRLLGRVGAAQQPKLYGIAGYTPITIKVPKGPVKIIVELAGFKPQEQVLDVRKSQTLLFDAGAGAARWRRLDLQASADGAPAARSFIDGVPRGTAPEHVRADRPAATRSRCARRAASRSRTGSSLQEGERRTRDVSLEQRRGADRDAAGQLGRGRRRLRRRQRKDVAPAIITGVPAGDHVVEVRKDGLPALAPDGHRRRPASR